MNEEWYESLENRLVNIEFHLKEVIRYQDQQELFNRQANARLDSITTRKPKAAELNAMPPDEFDASGLISNLQNENKKLREELAELKEERKWG